MSGSNRQPEEIVRVDLAVYTMEAVLKSAYRFTGRCYCEITSEEGIALVRLRPKHPDDGPGPLAGEFRNELIDQRLRTLVARETAETRDLIMRHALSETGFLRPDLEAVPPGEDPAGIAVPDRAHRAR